MHRPSAAAAAAGSQKKEICTSEDDDQDEGQIKRGRIDDVCDSLNCRVQK
jgi:hypothetical protein